MAFGSIIKDIKELVDAMKTEFAALAKVLEEVKSSQKRIEATMGSLLDKPKK